MLCFVVHSPPYHCYFSDEDYFNRPWDLTLNCKLPSRLKIHWFFGSLAYLPKEPFLCKYLLYFFSEWYDIQLWRYICRSLFFPDYPWNQEQSRQRNTPYPFMKKFWLYLPLFLLFPVWKRGESVTTRCKHLNGMFTNRNTSGCFSKINVFEGPFLQSLERNSNLDFPIHLHHHQFPVLITPWCY